MFVEKTQVFGGFHRGQEVKVMEQDELTQFQILHSLNWKWRFKSGRKLLITQIFIILYPFWWFGTDPKTHHEFLVQEMVCRLVRLRPNEMIWWLKHFEIDLVKTRGVKKLNSTDFHSVQIDRYLIIYDNDMIMIWYKYKYKYNRLYPKTSPFSNQNNNRVLSCFGRAYFNLLTGDSWESGCTSEQLRLLDGWWIEACKGHSQVIMKRFLWKMTCRGWIKDTKHWIFLELLDHNLMIRNLEIALLNNFEVIF